MVGADVETLGAQARLVESGSESRAGLVAELIGEHGLRIEPKREP
jgi:hypothetical protein